MRASRLFARNVCLSKAAGIVAVMIACIPAAAALEPPITREPPIIEGEVTLQALLDVTSEADRLLISQGPRDMAWYGSSTAYVRVPGRSEERRVGKEVGRSGRSGWSPDR